MMYYGTEVNALNFGVKKFRESSRSRRNNTCWNHHCTGGGVQYLTSHVELDFLVVPELLQIRTFPKSKLLRVLLEHNFSTGWMPFLLASKH